MGTGATLGFSLPLHLKHRPRRAFLRGRPPHSPPGPRLPSAAPTSTNRSHRDARCQRRLLPPPPPKKKTLPRGQPHAGFHGWVAPAQSPAGTGIWDQSHGDCRGWCGNPPHTHTPGGGAPARSAAPHPREEPPVETAAPHRGLGSPLPGGARAKAAPAPPGAELMLRRGESGLKKVVKKIIIITPNQVDGSERRHATRPRAGFLRRESAHGVNPSGFQQRLVSFNLFTFI